MKSARELAIADVTITLTDAVRGNFVDDESLAAIAIDLVDQIERRKLAELEEKLTEEHDPATCVKCTPSLIFAQDSEETT